MFDNTPRMTRGKTCPKCGSKNTSSPDGDLVHCFKCGKTTRIKKGKK